MTFDELLVRRDELREEHAGWCDDVNGPLGYGEGSYEARARDRAYRELCEVEEAIGRVLDEERAAEERAAE